MIKRNEKILRVIICDDHVLYRAGVKCAFSNKKDIKVIGEVDNGSQLLHLLMEREADVILLDMEMPIMDGITTLPQLKQLYPHIRVMMLTMKEDQRMVINLMTLGANGYVSKASNPATLYEAIKNCYEQEFYLTPLIRKTILTTVDQKRGSSGHRAYITLSKIEMLVLQLICEERSTRQIAEVVYRSTRTIESIRENLKVKIGAKSTVGLIIYAMKNKLFDQQDNW